MFVAGILFGALKAGGFTMQASQGIPIDIVLVVQSLIVLFIAAPPLVRAIFFLPKPDAEQGARQGQSQGREEGGGGSDRPRPSPSAPSRPRRRIQLAP